MATGVKLPTLVSLSLRISGDGPSGSVTTQPVSHLAEIYIHVKD
jgi:hypothetical protein